MTDDTEAKIVCIDSGRGQRITEIVCESVKPVEEAGFFDRIYPAGSNPYQDQALEGHGEL